jgi:hypothetical protein
MALTGRELLASGSKDRSEP